MRRIVGRNAHGHSLRHTYASFLISHRVELLSISKILGHENMNITIEVYAHQLKELEEESNSEVREIFANLGAKHLKHPVKSRVYMPPAGIEPATTP